MTTRSATDLPYRTVTTTDGLRLAVYETGSAELPTALLIHGYPDDHTVWDGLVRLLADRFRVVTYDVRGAGRSARPKSVRAYRIAQLVDDLAAVIDAVAADRGVHVIGHDWGSMQAWDALSDPRFAGRILSFTSISGPSLDMVAAWMRRVREHPRPVRAQALASYYMPVLLLPVIPTLLARSGLLARGIAVSSSRGKPAGAAVHTPLLANTLDGIKLYRANLAHRMLFPKPRRTAVPVQVLAPVADMHATVACQTDSPRPYVDNLTTHEVEGNHWVIAQRPDIVADCFVEFVAGLAAG